MTVTDIRKTDSKRFCLYIDYEPFASVYPSDIKSLRLVIGKDIAPEKLESFRRDVLFKRAMNSAVSSIKFSDKCVYDIRKKLEEMYYDQDIVQYTIDKLLSYGYLDDYRYACGYIRGHIGRKSLKIIRYELMGRHIAQEVIDKAIGDTDIPDEEEVIRHQLTKRFCVEELANKKDKVRMYMYRKGYDSRKVSRCIEELISRPDAEN